MQTDVIFASPELHSHEIMLILYLAPTTGGEDSEGNTSNYYAKEPLMHIVALEKFKYQIAFVVIFRYSRDSLSRTGECKVIVLNV